MIVEAGTECSVVLRLLLSFSKEARKSQLSCIPPEESVKKTEQGLNNLDHTDVAKANRLFMGLVGAVRIPREI